MSLCWLPPQISYCFYHNGMFPLLFPPFFYRPFFFFFSLLSSVFPFSHSLRLNSLIHPTLILAYNIPPATPPPLPLPLSNFRATPSLIFPVSSSLPLYSLCCPFPFNLLPSFLRIFPRTNRLLLLQSPLLRFLSRVAYSSQTYWGEGEGEGASGVH